MNHHPIDAIATAALNTQLGVETWERALIEGAPTIFDHYWWDDAIAFARQVAADSELRQRVTRKDGWWHVELANDQRPHRARLALVTEPCS